MTLAPIIPGYEPPAEQELHFTCSHCGCEDRLHYRQRGEQIYPIVITDTGINASKPYLSLWGIAHLVCGNCKHPVGERSAIHDAVMKHMRT